MGKNTIRGRNATKTQKLKLAHQIRYDHDTFAQESHHYQDNNNSSRRIKECRDVMVARTVR